MPPATVRDVMYIQAVAAQVPWLQPHKVDESLFEAETEAEGVIQLLEPGVVGVSVDTAECEGQRFFRLTRR
jgi:hypothetical protein